MRGCTLCGGRVTGDDQSKEHILLAALGSWRTVSGFICRSCNSETGKSWDAVLSGDLEDLARMLNISRERGPVRPRIFYTSEDLPIKVLPGNRVELGHTSVKPFNDGSREGKTVIAGSTDELREIAQKINDRRPLTEDVDAILAGRSERTGYLREAVGYRINIPGDDAHKSLVKSVLALTFEAGVEPACADAAINYLTNDNAEKCIFPYYKENLVSPRISGMPLNCVYVKGDPINRKLMGYVEIFGFLRRVVRLSDAYEGKHFEHYYAIDPSDGSELQVEIRLDPSILREAEEQPDYEQEKRVVLDVLTDIVETVKAKAEHQEIDLLVRTAIGAWYDENGKGSEEVLTVEECHSLSRRIAEAVAPYMLHLMMPLQLPENVLQQLSQAEITDWRAG